MLPFLWADSQYLLCFFQPQLPKNKTKQNPNVLKVIFLMCYHLPISGKTEFRHRLAFFQCHELPTIPCSDVVPMPDTVGI